MSDRCTSFDGRRDEPHAVGGVGRLVLAEENRMSRAIDRLLERVPAKPLQSARIASRLAAITLGVIALVAGVTKFFAVGLQVELFEYLGLSRTWMYAAAALEVFAAIQLLSPSETRRGAFVLMAVMSTAAALHLFQGDYMFALLPTSMIMMCASLLGVDLVDRRARRACETC